MVRSHRWSAVSSSIATGQSLAGADGEEAAMSVRLFIYEWLEPVSERNRYRIVETYECVDGMRSRLTDQSFATLDEAKAFVADPIKNYSQSPSRLGSDII